MRWIVLAMVFCFSTLCLSTHAFGNFLDAPLDPPPADTRQPSPEADTHPVLSADGSWIGIAVIVVLGMFLVATAVGISVRAETADLALVSSAHDEHAEHAVSHHH